MWQATHRGEITRREALLINPGMPIPAEATAVHYRVSCELLPEDSGVEAAADLEAQLGALADLDRFEAGPERWIIRLETTSPGSTVECLAAAGRLRELHIAVSQDEHRGLRRSPALGVTG